MADSSDQERQAALHAIAERIEANAPELAELVVRQGKPMPLAQMEVEAAISWTRYTAELEVLSSDRGERHQEY
ncbi:MAG: aldehyde dehydrogenase family protein [Halomonas sp.]|nr:aldehyde dehydrogenase family protein [Halomonas sp.]MDZ7854536.1 aldehyde dehydrogenase family protein [Halomonas sp.]